MGSVIRLYILLRQKINALCIVSASDFASTFVNGDAGINEIGMKVINIAQWVTYLSGCDIVGIVTN